jgi:hypothetical protein
MTFASAGTAARSTTLREEDLRRVRGLDGVDVTADGARGAGPPTSGSSVAEGDGLLLEAMLRVPGGGGPASA